MLIEVELGDLQQLAFALDGAITTMDPDVEGLVHALEIVQTYIDNASEDNGSESSSEENTGEDATEVQADTAEADFEDDIPF